MDVSGLSVAATIWAELDFTRQFQARIPASADLVMISPLDMCSAADLRAGLERRVATLEARLRDLGSLID